MTVTDKPSEAARFIPGRNDWSAISWFKYCYEEVVRNVWDSRIRLPQADTNAASQDFGKHFFPPQASEAIPRQPIIGLPIASQGE